jgi:hypothetical protein
VWLNAAAPADVVDRMAAQGPAVITDTTVDDVVSTYARHGPGVALRFELFAAVGSCRLVAAGAVIVSAIVQRATGLMSAPASHQGLRVREMASRKLRATLLVVAGAIVTGLMRPALRTKRR